MFIKKTKLLTSFVTLALVLSLGACGEVEEKVLESEDEVTSQETSHGTSDSGSDDDSGGWYTTTGGYYAMEVMAYTDIDLDSIGTTSLPTSHYTIAEANA